MKQETYDRLTKYNSYLYTAHNADYIRALSNREVDELIEIGNELGIYYKNNHCPKCALEFVKKLAVQYFAYKPEVKEPVSEKAKEVAKKTTKGINSTRKTTKKN